MKKNYLIPQIKVVKVGCANMIAQSIVTNVGGNASLNYGGGGSGAARVREQTNYDVWNDNWSE